MSITKTFETDDRFRYLIEQLEWGCASKKQRQAWVNELWKSFRYKYKN